MSTQIDGYLPAEVASVPAELRGRLRCVLAGGVLVSHEGGRARGVRVALADPVAEPLGPLREEVSAAVEQVHELVEPVEEGVRRRGARPLRVSAARRRRRDSGQIHPMQAAAAAVAAVWRPLARFLAQFVELNGGCLAFSVWWEGIELVS